MIKVKICGITNVPDALTAAAAGADYIGFVFAESPRRVSPARAGEIIKALKGSGVSAVGVFVNEKERDVRNTAELCSLDVLQFHGDEPPEYCRRFSDYIVFKAFRLKNEVDIPVMKEYDVCACLADAFVEGRFGGTGRIIPPGLASKAGGAVKRMILSGGLTPDNVSSCIGEVEPFGVDVSSGVEKSPGLKDDEKMRIFINAARRF
jgi:phosphoribosylanthranilate isomerase